MLEQIEKTNPNQDAVIKCLLRTYEGMFDEETNISEKLIAKLIPSKLEKVVEILGQLHAQKIIEYKPQKITPQLYFNYNRASANHITFNNEKYLWRKQQFIQRVNAMHSFLQETNECRAQQIANYFGDNTTPLCSICDVCLHKKQTPLTANELIEIKEKIVGIIENKPIEIGKLLPQLKTIPKYKIWEAIQFLQDEKEITINKFGVLSLP